MLLSRYDPVQKKVVFGPAAGALPAGGSPPGAMPAAPMRMAPPAGPASPVMPGGMAISLPEISVGPGDAAPAAAPAPASNAGGGMMRQPLGAYFNQLEQERGLPSGFLARTRAIESSNGTRLANPNSSARGDFQFIRSTAKQYGIDPMDPYASAKAAADMAKSNMDVMARKGITADGADLYAAHQQGIGGYLKLRSGQTTGGAAMGLNGGAGLSPSEFLGKWRTSYNNAKPGNLGEGFTPNYPSPGENQGQGPTVASAAKLTPSGVPAVGGDAGGGTPTPAATPAPDSTYKGGLLGLAGIGDQSAPGMNKDFSGKMADMVAQPGMGALGGLAKALPSLLGGGGAPSRAPMQFGPAPEDHKPDASLLALLDPKNRRRGVM